MRILGYAYRTWATNIIWALKALDHEVQVETETSKVNKVVIEKFNPDLILFYGWSWRVPDWLVENYIALCLHPSPLPKYRGGSPIQNQILNGEKESTATIFRMTKDVDEGPICAQLTYSLEGSLKDVFSNLSHVGLIATEQLIEAHMNGGIHYWPQDGEATIYDRRLPFQSEITHYELEHESSEYLYNKIRMLQDPYPNAYIECHDGKKLYITEAHL